MPLVSVVMPVYNQERYVALAVESILNQTFADFELVIVDDGSTDNTVQEVSKFADSRMRVVSSAHVGFLGALERGVREAQGKWVARMDSDDISQPDRLQRQLDFLTQHPECLFVGSIYGIVTPNGKLLSPRVTFDWDYLSFQDITLATQLFADPSAVFDRRKALEIGLYDPDFENEKPLWYRFLAIGRGAVMGQPLHYIRWLMGSHSRRDFNKRRATNYEIRRKYDPKSLHLLNEPIDWDQKRSTLNAAIRCVNYYITAGDKRVAREVAMEMWRKYPYDISALRLVTQSLLKFTSLQFWKASESTHVPEVALKGFNR